MEERIILYPAYILFALLIFFTFAMWINANSDDQIYKNKVIAMDLALSTDLVAAGNGIVEVERDIEGLFVNVADNCEFEVGEIDGDETSPIFRSSCTLDGRLINDFGEAKNKINIKRENNRLGIS